MLVLSLEHCRTILEVPQSLQAWHGTSFSRPQFWRRVGGNRKIGFKKDHPPADRSWIISKLRCIIHDSLSFNIWGNRAFLVNFVPYPCSFSQPTVMNAILSICARVCKYLKTVHFEATKHETKHSNMLWQLQKSHNSMGQSANRRIVTKFVVCPISGFPCQIHEASSTWKKERSSFLVWIQWLPNLSRCGFGSWTKEISKGHVKPLYIFCDMKIMTSCCWPCSVPPKRRSVRAATFVQGSVNASFESCSCRLRSHGCRRL